MVSVLQVVVFVFAYVRRAPRSNKDLAAVSSVRAQRASILLGQKLGDIEIIHERYSWTTNRRSPFCERPEFHMAIREAKKAGAAIAVADIASLLAEAPANKIQDCEHALNNCTVDIWDQRLRRRWQSVPDVARTAILATAAHTRNTRSNLVKLGLLKAGEARSVKHSNFRNGTQGNIQRADRMALRLKDVVLAENAKLPPGSALSPSALARSLNDQNITSPRGGRWSHNTAKALLDRVLLLQRSLPPPEDVPEASRGGGMIPRQRAGSGRRSSRRLPARDAHRRPLHHVLGHGSPFSTVTAASGTNLTVRKFTDVKTGARLKMAFPARTCKETAR
ncbi:hypothetical protein RB623_09880 [Mesorhizobium sp. LHD-90]|uniref:hypothetical protein n=1 Tax=Mesorhizobium sp. LHD-90 TaxID=3071414 RepID=UPI0027E0F8E6|nr:hypothetical protein [Mesorhizobium sp. LHD-90]MDQ6434357.1 hypothetical protein [Mesorhizobium sp. LHD-90]